MKIDFEKIEEIYGSSVIEEIKNNSKDILENIQYLKELKINDIEDIFERYPLIFICDKNEFKNKVDKLISKIGINYVDMLDNDMELWEELM